MCFIVLILIGKFKHLTYSVHLCAFMPLFWNTFVGEQLSRVKCILGN